MKERERPGRGEMSKGDSTRECGLSEERRPRREPGREDTTEVGQRKHPKWTPGEAELYAGYSYS